jgi:CCR4-NOT transcription complex subunit 2
VAKAGAGQRASDYNGSTAKAPENRESQPPESVDLLAGMPETDKWGIKGLRTLMNNYPDYHAMIVGLDPQALGLDVASPE